VIDLITKIYHNLSSQIEDKVHDIEDQFNYECLSRLKDVAYDQSLSGEEKKQMCYVTFHMLKSFFEDSERLGTGMMKTF
jgi:hypothetical protein